MCMEFLDNNIQPARDGDVLVCYHFQVVLGLSEPWRYTSGSLSSWQVQPSWTGLGRQKVPDYTRDRADVVSCFVVML